MKKNCRTFIAVLVLTLGCERHDEINTPPIAALKREYILAFVLDTSGSFTHKMFEGSGLGYKFFLRASDQFFANRMGEDDRILISQLSANDRSLLWEGPPLALRRRFGSSASLRTFIEQKSIPAGSRVYASVAETLEYILELPGVSGGETKVCVVVLSDMLDNSETQQQDRKRMDDALAQFAQVDGCIGLYWVDQTCLSDCRRCLKNAGIGNSVVESEIVEEPQLPTFR